MFWRTYWLCVQIAIEKCILDNISGDYLIDYPHDEKPVFLGHYWMKVDIQPLAENITCLDLSVADAKDSNARLVAYR